MSAYNYAHLFLVLVHNVAARVINLINKHITIKTLLQLWGFNINVFIYLILYLECNQHTFNFKSIHTSNIIILNRGYDWIDHIVTIKYHIIITQIISFSYCCILRLELISGYTIWLQKWFQLPHPKLSATRCRYLAA